MNKTRRHYDVAFKRHVAELYLSNHQPLATLAKDLDVPESTIHRWVVEYKQHGKKSFEPREMTAHEREIMILKRQLADVSMERDILKKAIAIFSKKK